MLSDAGSLFIEGLMRVVSLIEFLSSFEILSCQASLWIISASSTACDMSVGMVCITYSVDIPRYRHDCISIVQMITQVLCVEISVQCLCLLSRIGEVTFSLWYIKIIRIRINNHLSNNITDGGVP